MIVENKTRVSVYILDNPDITIREVYNEDTDKLIWIGAGSLISPITLDKVKIPFNAHMREEVITEDSGHTLLVEYIHYSLQDRMEEKAE